MRMLSKVVITCTLCTHAGNKYLIALRHACVPAVLCLSRQPLSGFACLLFFNKSFDPSEAHWHNFQAIFLMMAW
jgi:hypothetical protein